VVCVLPAWPPDHLLQQVAAQHGGLETAFLVAEPQDVRLRWFSSTQEVHLCGHATLAAGFVYLRQHPEAELARFGTCGGPLEVRRDGERYRLRLPAYALAPVEPPPMLVTGLGEAPQSVYQALENYYAVYDRADRVSALVPDFEALRTLHPGGVCVTAPGGEEGVDVVSRFFAPGYGIPEDPVSGQPHCALVPFWCERLGERSVRIAQLSSRGGCMTGEHDGAHVWLSGEVTPYLEGTLRLPEGLAEPARDDEEEGCVCPRRA
jgi:predicted PhzF superfamily epimerase YddE/YHI9